MSLESTFLAQVQKRHGARDDLRLFRNAVAKAWVGKVVARTDAGAMLWVPGGCIVLQGARQIHAGLVEGSADIIGIRTEPHMVDDGMGAVGRFISLELKTENVTEQKNQIAWGEMVRKFGGLHAVARDMDDVDRALGTPP